MPDSNKTTATERRTKIINSLRINVAQASSWQDRLVGLLEELHRDNVALRNGYAQMSARIEALEKERITA